MLARKEWRERRRANDLPEAKVAKRGRDRTNKAPDYSRDVGAALPSERYRGKWSRDDCVAWVARYLGQLGPGERPTANGYTDWAAAQELAPVLTCAQSWRCLLSS